jgi:hypothetical protein
MYVVKMLKPRRGGRDGFVFQRGGVMEKKREGETREASQTADKDRWMSVQLNQAVMQAVVVNLTQ